MKNMKKALSIVITTAVLLSAAAFGTSVSAASNAFNKETFRIGASSILYDNVDNSGDPKEIHSATRRIMEQGAQTWGILCAIRTLTSALKERQR